MFEMDAFVGVDVLGLQFMKGEQPHAGFPEAAYHLMAEQLARAGYRVVVVEQVTRGCNGLYLRGRTPLDRWQGTLSAGAGRGSHEQRGKGALLSIYVDCIQI